MYRKLFASALACVLSASAAQAVELKFNLFVSPRTSEGIMLTAFAKDLATKTDGRVTMRIFPGGQLFSAPATLGGIRSGAIDGGFIVNQLNMSELKHVNIVDDIALYQTNDMATLFAANETLLVQCKECQEDFKAQNAINLGAGAIVPWLLFCNKPMRTLADVKGVKTRVIGPAASRMASELGMVGVNLASSEIAPAMASGQIDCAVGPAAWIIDYALWGAVKAIVNLPIGISPTTMFAFNRESWNKLPPADQKIVLDLIPTHLVAYTKSYAKRSDDVFDEAKKRGVQVLEPADDLVKALNAFREKDLPNVVTEIKARGVADPKKIVDYQMANVKKWEAKLGGKLSDEQLADLMRKEIIAKRTN